ncbi:zinc-dependent metalloprotease [Pseudonocardiaceae bacterium YIM PH 21723]|nr:zinc-dependent metalloprotease [Pseudonocardiaceae bacterium YIM PH 21723]
MSNVPFGFSPGDPDQNNPGGMPPGFDVGQLGQMLTQLGQMLSQAQSGAGGPVNYDVAKQMAVQKVAAAGDLQPTAEQHAAVSDAVHLAELWLDGATSLPAGARVAKAWSAQEWVEQTLGTWKRLCDPVAEQMSGAWVQAMPEEAKQAAGPLLAMISQMGGLAFGSQLGSGLGQLATEVLGSTEVGLPLGPDAVAALIPANVEKFTEGLERPASEVMVYLAAREAAHHRLFVHVPWLRARLLGTVEEYAKGIKVDTAALEEIAGKLDPSNPAALEEAMSGGLLEPQTTPEQKAALVRLETLLALVEGWVDEVVAQAVGERLPGAAAMRETLRRRRASGGPAEQTFATLIGLELRPRRLRDAANLWALLTERHGADARDAVWAHPDLMPTSEDLDEPLDFADRLGKGALDGIDPIEELEKTQRRDDEA